MSNRSSVTASKTLENTTPVKSSKSVVRIEDSLEDFVSLYLPSSGVGSCRLEIKPLWSDVDGNKYLRCTFWKYNYEGFCITRKAQKSHYVKIEYLDNGMRLVDLTGNKFKVTV